MGAADTHPGVGNAANSLSLRCRWYFHRCRCNDSGVQKGFGVRGLMNNTKLYRHRQTNELYAIRHKGSGELVGSAGPLDKNQIDDLEALHVTGDNNAWIQENAHDLILVSPVER